MALSGTHDTESLAQWWRELPEADRARAAGVARHAGGPVHAAVALRAAGARCVAARRCWPSASRYVMVPLQDVFGWDVRINTPATVNDSNWTWRVPVPVDRWQRVAGVDGASRGPGRVDRRGRAPFVTAAARGV